MKLSSGNSGIGYEIALQLALHGARVYIAGRSSNRVKNAIEQMQASSARALDLHMLEMDLQSLRSVKEGAESFIRQESRLDLLINNAGVSTLLFMPLTIKPANCFFRSRSWQSPTSSRPTASKQHGKPTISLPFYSPRRSFPYSKPQPHLATPRHASVSSTYQAISLSCHQHPSN